MRKQRPKKEAYVIRVYRTKYGFERYDDNIYREKEKNVNPKDVLFQRITESRTELLLTWKLLLKKYEGYTYCVKNANNDDVITGGIYDPNDDEYIEEYFAGAVST